MGKLRKFLKLIGPYPYNPYLLFLFCFSIFFFRFFRAVAFLPPGIERVRATVLIFLVSAIPGLLYAGCSILLTRFRFWSSRSTLLYVLEVATFQFLILQYLQVTLKVLNERIGYSDAFLVATSVKNFLIGLVLFLAALALMHQAERNINERLQLATSLVKKLEKERAELIQSEEILRQQISQFLHDRVQSDLMVVGMQLKTIAEESPHEIRRQIEQAINHLENTRATDLKSLIQVLTPNLEVGTLSSAVDSLLEKYLQSMDILLHLDDKSEDLSVNNKLGIYRIIEQAVLNALVHGPAKRVQISVKTDNDGCTEIIIADDGPGVSPEKTSPGAGTAIIDSWVSILSGVKEIDSAPGHGYRLQVTFPK